jgi:hypothetical protein
MDWITVLLILLLIAELAGFGYLIYLVVRELKFTLKDASRLKEPIESLTQDVQRLQPLVEILSYHANRMMGEVQVIVQLGRDTKEQVKTLSGAVAALRSPEVRVAVNYGRQWIEDRRANSIVRKLKRASRKIKKKLAKIGVLS